MSWKVCAAVLLIAGLPVEGSGDQSKTLKTRDLILLLCMCFISCSLGLMLPQRSVKTDRPRSIPFAALHIQHEFKSLFLLQPNCKVTRGGRGRAEVSIPSGPRRLGDAQQTERRPREAAESRGSQRSSYCSQDPNCIFNIVQTHSL